MSHGSVSLSSPAATNAKARVRRTSTCACARKLKGPWNPPIHSSVPCATRMAKGGSGSNSS
eukprot:scaffold147_cov327-Pavlova_lutheri.AAC.1